MKGTTKSRLTAVAVSMILLLQTLAQGAQLGFVGPTSPVRPGEPFTISLVASFSHTDINGWRGDAVMGIGVNVAWPDGVTVVSCRWNTAAWSCASIEQDDWSLWAVGRAVDFSMMTSAVVIAELDCAAAWCDGENFYYAIDSFSFPEPTFLTITDSTKSKDLLGDPRNAEDGVDECALQVETVPGYFLTLNPAQRNVPFMVRAAEIGIDIRRAASAALYDHVRAYVQFNSTVFSLDDMAVLYASLPAFFTNVVVHCHAECALPAMLPRITVVADANDDEVVIDAYCAPTNYAGRFATVPLMPQDTAENSEITLAFGDSDWFTTVDRYGINLLGASDDEMDGTEDTAVTVGHVDGLRVALAPVNTLETVGSAAQARLVLRKSVDGVVAFDNVALDVRYDGRLITCTTVAFEPNTAAIGTGVTWRVTITTNAPADAAPEAYPWTNTLLSLSLDWGLGACSTGTNELVLGTLRFTPIAAGVVGFLRADIDVTRLLASLGDDAAGDTEWPALFSCVNSAQGMRSVRVALEPEATQPPVVGLGETINLHPVVRGTALTAAVYSLAWAYDTNLVELVTRSAAVTSMVMRMTGETTAVLRAMGAVSMAGTADLGRIQFKARRPGEASFRPVTWAMSPANCGTFTEHGADVLGASGIAGDGVTGCGIEVSEPEGVLLVLEPVAALHAGVATDIRLSLANPAACYWDRMAARLEFDFGSFWTDAAAWRLHGLWSATINTVAIEANDDDLPTNVATMTRLAATSEERNDSCILASMPLMPLDDMAYQGISVDDVDTLIEYGGLSLADGDALAMDSTEWAVYPSGAGIMLDDGGRTPVLGSNHTVAVRITNPHGVRVTRAAGCWYFDAAVFEVVAVRLAAGCTTNDGGRVLVNNYRGSDSYIAMDVRLAAASTNASIALLEVTLVPKVNEMLEMVPGMLPVYDGEVPLAVWNQADVNVLELMGQWAEDVCPIWRRGIMWRDMPQVAFDEIDLDPYEVKVIPLDSALRNFSSDKIYIWRVAGAPKHVSFSINPLTRIMTVTSLDSWSGSERFTLYCQEQDTPTTGFTSFQVVLNDGEQRLDVTMRREEFRWITGQPFREAAFTVLGTTGPVAVTAWLQYPDKTWRQAAVRNDGTGATGDVLDIRSQGRVVWQGASPGTYLGRIDVRDAAAPTNQVAGRAWFTVELIPPGVDSDGDIFFLVYKRWNTVRAYVDTVVNIVNGTDYDTLVLNVYKGPRGDGRVDLDTISSDHGIKKIILKGSVKTVCARGPIGLLKVTGGVVGEVIASNGTVGAIVVKNIWDKGAEAFAGAGIARGVYATKGIGVVAVYGGSIGADDAPAVLCAADGSIASVTTKVMKKKLPFMGGAYTEIAGDDGAHIYASISALRGSIGGVTALGGAIGTIYETEPCTIAAGGTIGKVRARSAVCDGVPYGGAMRANISAGSSIAGIEAAGGDIARSEVVDPEDIAEIDHLPVRIAAPIVTAIKCTARVVNDGMSLTPVGGSIHADIMAAASFGSLDAKGGNARLWLHAPTIGSVKVKTVRYKEYRTDIRPLRRGGSMISSIIATTTADKFKSEDPTAYVGSIGTLAVDAGISGSWIGFRGPNRWDQYGYKKFACSQCVNTEFWEAKGSFLHVEKF